MIKRCRVFEKKKERRYLERIRGTFVREATDTTLMIFLLESATFRIPSGIIKIKTPLG